MILSEDPFESLKLKFLSENNHIQIEPLELRAFDGSLAGAFFSDTDEKGKKIRFQINSADMDGVRLFKFLGTDQAVLEGRVNWKADLEGNSAAGTSSLAWSGPVSLSLKNGVLSRFNYLQGFTEMDFLKGDAATSAAASERISLKNFDLSGRVENERLNAETIKLDSEQFKMDGEGDVSGAGILNFRLKTYLEASFFKQIFPKRAEDFISSEESFFGPVTLLASGPLDALEFKPDPQSVAELAGRYARKKTEAFSKYL